ncbi:MAG: hypothetical protein SOY89_03840 [Dysosmobacter sp.]|nr:hypothetical protein [Dysosmobacter sp.]
MRRAAADFQAAERPENRGIVKASEKSVTFSTAKRAALPLFFHASESFLLPESYP